MAYHAHFFFQQFHARITVPTSVKNFIKLHTSPTTANNDKKLCIKFSSNFMHELLDPPRKNKDKKLYTIFQPHFSKVKSARVILVIFELTMGVRIWNAMIDQN